MPEGYTQIDKPVQGDAVRKPLVDALIDNDGFFNSVISSLNWLQLPNGSFEIDSDADGEPDLWDIVLYTGGAFVLTGNLLADTDCRHGARAIKFTSPGGGGNGGGYVTSTEYNECAPDRPVLVSWLQKSTVATVRNKVEILWFDANRASVSSTTIYTSITNPTSWTLQIGGATPPSTARFMKVRLTGAENTTTVAGSVYFDGVQLRTPDRMIELTTAGTQKWKCHAGVAGIYAIVLGAGGGGGGDTSNANAGGGSGGMAQGAMAVTAGTTYTIAIGAGGAGGNNTAGAAGGNTTFNGYTGNGGSGGAVLGGSGGAGGTASGGQTNTTGTAGSARTSTTIGGDGGQSPWSNAAGGGGVGTNVAGTAGSHYGAGGGGGGGGTGVGGNGSPGTVIIFF